MKFGNWYAVDRGDEVHLIHANDTTKIILKKDTDRGVFRVEDRTLYGEHIELTYIRADFVTMQNYHQDSFASVMLEGRRLRIRVEGIDNIDVKELGEP